LPDPVVVVVALDVSPPTIPAPTVGDVCSEPSMEDTLLMSEIRLYIAINVVSWLNAAELTRSLSVEELLLREFLLDQILSL
jgi:hypothetical protein